MDSEQSGSKIITIYDLLDSIGNKEIDKAIQIVDELLSKGERPTTLLIMTRQCLQKLYDCKSAISQNEDIAEYLLLKPCQKSLIPKYKEHSNNFTEEELQRLIAALSIVGTLYFHIITSMDLGLALKSIICGIGKSQI